MKKLISLFLMFSLIALSVPLSAKEKKGADLILKKKDGTQVRGELIAVKESSLLLMERNSGADVSINIDDIRVIRIVKKSKALLGGVAGALIGGGVFTGLVEALSDINELFWGFLALVAAGGLVIGGVIGAVVGIDKTIQLEGQSESEIQEILEKLRKKARIRSAR